MRGPSVQRDVATHDRAGETARPADHRAEFHARDVVQGEDAVGTVTVQDAGVQQLARALAGLFCRLEKEQHATAFKWLLVKLFRQSEQDGGMTVMAALVGDAGRGRGVGEIQRLIHSHRVEVATEQQGRTGTAGVENRQNVAAVGE